MTKAVFITAVALACGCAHAPPPPPTVAEPAVPSADQGELALGVGDTFDVRVFGEPDLSATYRVGADGTIDYPLVGQVQVEGLEPHKAANLIANKLSQKYLKNPQVSILVREQPSKKITVIGQVSRPGTFPFATNMNVVEAITVAGGFTPIAAKNRTTITRVHDGRKISMEVPVSEIGEGKARNVLLRPGDIISVPERIF